MLATRVCECCRPGKTLTREVVSDVWRQAELLLAARMQKPQITGAQITRVRPETAIIRVRPPINTVSRCKGATR